MRFDSAMATIEPQKNVVARTVWTENILLVSVGLVVFMITLTQLTYWKYRRLSLYLWEKRKGFTGSFNRIFYRGNQKLCVSWIQIGCFKRSHNYWITLGFSSKNKSIVKFLDEIQMHLQIWDTISWLVKHQQQVIFLKLYIILSNIFWKNRKLEFETE